MQLFRSLHQSVLYTLIAVHTQLWIASFGQTKIPDGHVTCTYSKDCILPCTFPPSAKDVVIQWFKQGTLIYSFLEDDPVVPDNNMSVFTDEVLHGNASLLLEDSNIKNRGRYKCVVNSTNSVQESYVIVKVEAPISWIAIEASQTAHVQCLSSGVYPAPMLKWTTEPSFAQSALQTVTRITTDSNGLYSIESTLRKLNISVPPTYICSIFPKYTTQTWRASLLQTEITGNEGKPLVIPCMISENLKHFTLTWTFMGIEEHTDILTFYSQTHKTISHWGDKAKLDQEKALMGDGSLYVKSVDSKLSGIYTCNFSSFQVTHTVQASIKIRASKAAAHTGSGEPKLWVLAVVVVSVVLLLVSFVIYRKCRGKSKHLEQDQQDTEMQAMNKGNAAEMLPEENKPLSEHPKGDS